MHFRTPKRLFYTKLCSTPKVCLNKYPQMIKNVQGKKFRGPKIMKFSLFGGSNFSPSAFFLYSDDTFIRQTFWVEQSFFHKFCMKKSFWGPKMHFSFFDFYHIISYGENDFVIQIIWQYFLQLHSIYVRPNTPGSNTVVHFWLRFFSWNLSNFVR